MLSPLKTPRKTLILLHTLYPKPANSDTFLMPVCAINGHAPRLTDDGSAMAGL
jgi:hypothetical protein